MSLTGPLPGVTRKVPAVCGADLGKEDDSQVESDRVEDFLMPNSYSGDSGDDVHEALIIYAERHRKIGCDIPHL